MSPEQALEFLVRRQLLRDPFDRAAAALGDRWPRALESLQLASAASRVVLVGPVACALRGHVDVIDEPRVGLVGPWNIQGAVLQELMAAGAMQVGFDTAPRGHSSREKWLSATGAAVTVGWLLQDRDHEIDDLLAVSSTVQVPGGGELRVPAAAALRDRAAASRWPADNALVPGLDAIVAVERAPIERPRPADWIVLHGERAIADRSLRPEHVRLAIPYAGELPVEVRRAASLSFKELVLRPGKPRTLRGAEFTVVDGAIAVTAAAPAPVLDDWLAHDDIVAAVDAALTDAYRLVYPNVNA